MINLLYYYISVGLIRNKPKKIYKFLESVHFYEVTSYLRNLISYWDIIRKGKYDRAYDSCGMMDGAMVHCVWCTWQDSWCLLMSDAQIARKASQQIGWIKHIVIMAYYVVGARSIDVTHNFAKLISSWHGIFVITCFCVGWYKRILIMRKMVANARTLLLDRWN